MTRLKTSLAAIALAAATSMSIPAPQAEAGSYRGGDGVVGIWVFIRKHPAEDIWEACRRVYGRDVYQVRGAGSRKARCYVDASEAGNPRGFNTTREFD